MRSFHSIGISRHRISTDGEGITTLVAAHGCPLDCKYCLNPQCKSGKPTMILSVKDLYERVLCDDLYFEATGGGITFGGGEPLLFAPFIADFIRYAKQNGRSWQFCIETSLSSGREGLSMLDGLIDRYIVDIKDADPDIYFSYTGRRIDTTMDALCHLTRFADRVTVRVPLIPGYNSADDNDRTVEKLRSMGFSDFDRFAYTTDINSRKSQKST